MRPFLVCVHDATPAYAPETRTIIRDLRPLIGRHLSFAVVPDWHGQWPLVDHRDYCLEISDAAEELLLHGYFHRRQRGFGPVTLMTAGADEMNGLDREQTRSTIARGQQVFAEVFGESARGFLPPAWQLGQVTLDDEGSVGLEHVMGFFSLRSRSGRSLPLATWTWDSSRWQWTGYLGHGIGWLLRSRSAGIQTLAIHPRDIGHGFWPDILRVIRTLLETGHEPTTASRLLEATGC